MHYTSMLDPFSLDSFFGDWYILHCLFSTPATTRASAASLKKFVTMLQRYGLLDETRTTEFKDAIDEQLPEWILRMEMFNDRDPDYSEYCIPVHGFDPRDL